MTGLLWSNVGRGLLHTLDDPQIAIGAPAKDLERGLIAFAVVGGRGLLNAIEFDDHDPLDKPGFVCFRRSSASQKSPPGSRDRRTGELGITGQRLRVRNRS